MDFIGLVVLESSLGVSSVMWPSNYMRSLQAVSWKYSDLNIKSDHTAGVLIVLSTCFSGDTVRLSM